MFLQWWVLLVLRETGLIHPKGPPLENRRCLCLLRKLRHERQVSVARVALWPSLRQTSQY